MAWIVKIGTLSTANLTEEERKNNATEFYNFFSQLGYTLESICGMLGNIEQESAINSGMKQSEDSSSGWGLIQWTPSTVLTNWCNDYGYLWYEGETQCERIRCEGTGEKNCSGYFFPSVSKPEFSYSWEEFTNLKDVELATLAYLYERERAGIESVSNRLAYAYKWYEFLSGKPVPPKPPTPTKRKKLKSCFMLRNINFY